MSIDWLDDPGGGPLLQWVRDHLDYPHDYCLIWPFSRTSSGYGSVAKGSKRVYVHRLICEKINGPAPTGYQAAHSCGRGDEGCVNPRHLSWKSPADNQLDRERHGTGHVFAKLTEQQADLIRRLKGREIPAVTAQRYGVTEANVRSIQMGKTWQPGRKKRLTPEAVRAIREARGKVRQRVLAAQYGVAKGTIGMIQTGRTHKTC